METPAIPGGPVSIHAARLDHSRRLQRMLRAVSKPGWHSTASLQKATQSMAPATCLAELRAQGRDIQCRYVGVVRGRKRYVYRVGK